MMQDPSSQALYAVGSEGGTVFAGAGVLRQVRGSLLESIDPRFFAIAIISAMVHCGIIWYFYQVKVETKEIVAIENVPERFAKLIIDKPLPKAVEKGKKTLVKKSEPVPGIDDAVAPKKSETVDRSSSQARSTFSQAERTHAKKAVAARAARVEKLVRNVGVLGMLTGTGTTTKGPAVVDVLSAMGTRKEVALSLDDALSKMSGLQRAGTMEVLERKLVKSKDMSLSHKMAIDDLVESVASARSVDLVKKGEFVLQRPESIEGAASSSVKRDNNAINAVVASHKASLRMTYEKFLKRDPGLSGKVSVRFTITASGTVTGVTIIENTSGNTDMENEILRKIRLWQFEVIPEGDVTVTYPFVFMPAS